MAELELLEGSVTPGMGGELISVLDGVAYGLLLVAVAAGIIPCFGTGGVLNLAHDALYVLDAYSAGLLCDGTWTGLASAAAAEAAPGAGAGYIVLIRTLVGAKVRPAADGPQMLAILGINPRLVHGGVLAASRGGGRDGRRAGCADPRSGARHREEVN